MSCLGVGGLSHPPPALPTDSSFDSLFKEFTSFMFGSEERRVSSPELQDSSGYQYGEVMLTADRGVFLLPAAAITADCVDSSPAGFLKDQSSVCSRRVTLQEHCSSLPPLSMNTYTDIQLLAGKNEDAAVVHGRHESPPSLSRSIMCIMNHSRKGKVERSFTLTHTTLTETNHKPHQSAWSHAEP
ncbi:tectonic-1-like [Notothenia coriiceps]|uniref:Tectonic-1-like n=1 Tax=Notothenia coriiceps TaxID=8208 RepID=A0A6I9PNM3_9TELE|nr:PREDICTED: tectonic-1-like [Notothenia coriiceps]